MNTLPIFFHNTGLISGEISLEEDTARHIVQVLRMDTGEQILLTDGKGKSAVATIVKTEKKKCTVSIADITEHQPRSPHLHLAIAFTKNNSRNEWLLEKITELGVHTITPLITARTERERIRYDRWTSILVSAMIQSQQFHLPVLNESAALSKVLQERIAVPQKMIAHCIATKIRRPMSQVLTADKETLILIGPEGDFTEDEVNLSLEKGCTPIVMGATRLRTETAAMAASAYFNMINNETA